MAVEIPDVYETFEVGDIKPQKDMDMLVGIGDVVLNGTETYQVFVFQGEKGKRAARMDNKFDLAYLDKVKEARGKDITDDPEGVIAAMQKLADAKPKIEEKVLERWADIAKDLDFEVGKPPKLEGELAEAWAKKDAAMADRKAAMDEDI